MKIPKWLENGFWILFRLVILIFAYSILNGSIEGGAFFKWFFALIGLGWALLGFKKLYFFVFKEEFIEPTGENAVRAFTLPILIILGLMLLINLISY